MANYTYLKFRTKLYLGYTLILILILLLSLLIYISFSKLEEDRQWVNHTYEVISSIQKSGAFLVDMETGVRGFLVSGKEQFLEPYHQGLNDFNTEWEHGKKLTSDNPLQTKHWLDLKRKKELWQKTVASPEIAMRREVRSGIAAVKKFQQISSRDDGKKIFTQLRDDLTVLDKKFVRAGDHDGADLIMNIFIGLLNQETGHRGFLLTGLEEDLEPFNQGMTDFNTHFDKLRKIRLSGKNIRIDEIINIKTLMEKWHRTAVTPEIDARRAMNSHPMRFADVAALLESGVGKRITDEMRGIIGDMIGEEQKLLFERARATESASKKSIMVVGVGTFCIIILGIIIAFVMVSTIKRQLGTEPENLAILADKLAHGDLSVDLGTEVDIATATGVYAANITMVKNLKAVVQQTIAVASGNYDQKVELRSGKDQLGKALSQMTETLSESSAKSRSEIYLRKGQTQLNEKLRGEQELSTITDITIRFLSEYFGAQVGAFYLLSGDDMLELSATYAYQKRKNISDRFKVGEGLVGQAAREKKVILLSEIPDDYIHITSGLGNTIPTNILVYPVKLEENLKGVIELASIHMFSDQQIDFLDTVVQSIVVTLQSAESRANMDLLLKKTQAQAEDLQSQQEELREANEILEVQKTSLLESEAMLQDQQEELRQTNEELEEQTQLLGEQKSSIQNKNIELEDTKKMIEEKAKDLELTSKYKSEFLANMSHELRTPLNSILLLSRILADNKEDTLTPKQQEYSNTIHLSGTELLDLINEILDLSKVEAGKMEVHLEQVSLKDLVQKFKRTFTPQAQEKGLTFLGALATDVPTRIKTDGQRLGQIIKNLISNALKFTTAGSISFNIGRPGDDFDLSMHNLKPEKTIALSVSDTGEGVDEEKQKLIFEAFQQADGTTSRKFGGSGLGLSISRELAKLLGGAIRLQSQPGKGSTFTIYLPETLEKQFSQGGDDSLEPEAEKKKKSKVRTEPVAQVANASAFVPDDRSTLKSGEKSILIIEDDSKFAKTLLELSRERGYKVLVAGDGETGLHFADYYNPDAIILDIGLPGMDGWSVMDRLKEQPTTRHIPVHFISAHDESIEARKMGAVGFITKPVSITSLDEAFGRIEHLTSGKIRKLLIVEDDDVQRKAMIELIGNGDVQTTEAASGKEAFSFIRTEPFDCIILDLGLPDVTGVEFLTHLKEDEAITEIPIIVYTGKELTHEEEGIINEYAEKIIIKGARSVEKLVDETTLFLHRVEADLPPEKRKMIRVLHDRESVFTGKKIMVVDDDMRNVYAITNVLEEKGLDVLVAHNGREGVTLLKETPEIDLVLMDIMMPDMNGYEAMKIIREDAKFKKLPIIALTAKAMQGDRTKCIDAGASDYLSKPVNIDKLLSMMRVWLY